MFLRSVLLSLGVVAAWLPSAAPGEVLKFVEKPLISNAEEAAMRADKEIVPTKPVVNKPKPFADFQPKRIKPPAPGNTTNRITIQIEPAPPAPDVAEEDDRAPTEAVPSAPALRTTPAAASPGRYAWFWEKISPDIAHSGPGRLSEALRALNLSNDIAGPRLQVLQGLTRDLGKQILTSTVGTNVSPALVLAVISVESSGRADAVSPAGAGGLMQLMPATATRFGVTDAMIPDQNISGGVKYLSWLMKEFDNDPILVLAGYNAGEGAVRNHKGVPPYAETRDYVPKVLAAFQVARGMCRTPPELITDGCVFVVMN